MNISILGKYYFPLISVLLITYFWLFTSFIQGASSMNDLFFISVLAWLATLLVVVCSRILYSNKSIFLALLLLLLLAVSVAFSYALFLIIVLLVDFTVTGNILPDLLTAGVGVVICSVVSLLPFYIFGLFKGDSVQDDQVTEVGYSSSQKMLTWLIIIIGTLVFLQQQYAEVQKKNNAHTEEIKQMLMKPGNLPSGPITNTYEATDITRTDALLTGTYSYITERARLYFEYGTTADLVDGYAATPKYPLIPDNFTKDEQRPYSDRVINKLTCGTVYYYRFNIETQRFDETQNSYEYPVVKGNIKSFSTLPCQSK